MIYGDLITMLLTAVLVVLFYTNTIQIWHIYIVIAGRAISGSFQSPALSASIRMIVTEKNLVRANGLNRALAGVISMIGPPSGAFLMKALPMQWVLSVDIITALIAVGCLLAMAIPQPPRTTLTTKFNVIGDMMQGFRYIALWKGLLFLVILASMANFFTGPINALMPLFVSNHLGGDVSKLGWLGTASAVGVIAGGLVLSIWGGFKRRLITCLTGIIVLSITLFVFGFTTESFFFMGLVLWLFAGLGSSTFNATIGAILQATVPRDMQGRIFTLLGSISTAMIPLGLALAGPVADAIGVRAIFFISGTALLILTIAGVFSRDLRNIENQKTVEKPAEIIPQTIPSLKNEE